MCGLIGPSKKILDHLRLDRNVLVFGQAVLVFASLRPQFPNFLLQVFVAFFLVPQFEFDFLIRFCTLTDPLGAYARVFEQKLDLSYQHFSQILKRADAPPWQR